MQEVNDLTIKKDQMKQSIENEKKTKEEIQKLFTKQLHQLQATNIIYKAEKVRKT